jgi:hypothetical protein
MFFLRSTTSRFIFLPDWSILFFSFIRYDCVRQKLPRLNTLNSLSPYLGGCWDGAFRDETLGDGSVWGWHLRRAMGMKFNFRLNDFGWFELKITMPVQISTVRVNKLNFFFVDGIFSENSTKTFFPNVRSPHPSPLISSSPHLNIVDIFPTHFYSLPL